MNQLEIVVETNEEFNKIDSWLQDEVCLPSGNYSVSVFNREDCKSYFYNVKENGYVYFVESV